MAIVYNTYIPVAGRNAEAQAELATAAAARRAAAAVRACGWRPVMFPVGASLPGVISRLRRRRPALLVNLCEGFAGRPGHEAHMAGLWELLGLPFTGNTARALSICQNKYQAKLLLQAAGVATPPGWLARRAADVPGPLHFPLIVKPVAEDGGIGVYHESVVNGRRQLEDRIRRVVRRYAQPALVEHYIDGREFNVAIIEEKEPLVLPLSEIVFQDFPAGQPRIVGYQAKWHPEHDSYRHTVPQCPASAPRAAAVGMRRAALRAWHCLGLRGYARFDFRLDACNRFYLLEANPNPDPAPDAGLARAWAATGRSYPDFWRGQAQTALRRWKGQP
ncbi:MAG: ATP-grasp domain-containing protein [Lentisphaerae bacterium]|nr:ATP-grasp domain-containing protein [Lentisphaerota bacterium]